MTPTLPQPNTTHWWTHWVDTLTQPAAALLTPDTQRQARLLASINLAMIFFVGIRLLVGFLSGSFRTDASFPLYYGLISLTAVAYGFSRTRFVSVSLLLLCTALALLAYGTILLRPPQTPFANLGTLLWILPGLLLGAFLFSWGVGVLWMVANFVMLLALPQLTDKVVFTDIASLTYTVLVLAGVVAVITRYRDLIEKDRQLELVKVNTQLREFNTTLEMRVQERTRDAVVAAEVGQRIAAVRDLDSLLIEAVDIIRARFDLYYAQVYLVNATGTALALQAGTGEVGRQLLQRAHRLPIGAGSLNGRAAAERRAVIVPNTAAHPSFRPNPLLPQTRSEMCVPLLLGDRVVGVLDLQSTRPEALTADNLSAFQVVAGQLAIAIQNANLFAEVQAARRSVELQAERASYVGWESFLNGIDRSEHVSYTYTPDAPIAVSKHAPPADRVGMTTPLTVAGALMGQIQIEYPDGHAGSEADQDLVQNIARQMAQHLENLRLLAQAEQYQQQVVQTTRRALRENWETYRHRYTEATGFQYNQTEVTSLPATASTDAAAAQPLLVRGEQIGELTLTGLGPLDETTTDLMSAVANRLSAHLENLRLFEQTQQALASTETQAERLAVLNELGRVLTTVRREDEIFEKVYEHVSRVLDTTNFYIATYDAAAQQLAFPILYDNNVRLEVASRPLRNGLTEYILRTGDALLLNDEVQAAMHVRGMDVILTGDGRIPVSWLGIPLRYGDQILGVMAVQSVTTPGLYTETERDLLTSIANQVSIALENIRSFTQIQRRAERETLINAINQKIQSASSVDSAVQIAAREIGQLLKVRRAVVEINASSAAGGEK